jgi:hypothetical protein
VYLVYLVSNIWRGYAIFYASLYKKYLRCMTANMHTYDIRPTLKDPEIFLWYFQSMILSSSKISDYVIWPQLGAFILDAVRRLWDAGCISVTGHKDEGEVPDFFGSFREKQCSDWDKLYLTVRMGPIVCFNQNFYCIGLSFLPELYSESKRPCGKSGSIFWGFTIHVTECN